MTTTAIEIFYITADTADFEVVQSNLEKHCDYHNNFYISHATSLATAKTHLQSHQFDLVITDLNLADSRGFATYNAVQSLVVDVPVIAVSAVHDLVLAKSVVRLGAQDCIFKNEIGNPSLITAII